MSNFRESLENRRSEIRETPAIDPSEFGDPRSQALETFRRQLEASERSRERSALENSLREIERRQEERREAAGEEIDRAASELGLTDESPSGAAPARQRDRTGIVDAASGLGDAIIERAIQTVAPETAQIRSALERLTESVESDPLPEIIPNALPVIRETIDSLTGIDERIQRVRDQIPENERGSAGDFLNPIAESAIEKRRRAAAESRQARGIRIRDDDDEDEDEEGKPCDYPGQTDSIGRRCGGRAASIREGGRLGP